MWSETNRRITGLYNTILFLVSLLIAVATLLYLNHLVRGRLRLEDTINDAVERSAFAPTVFRIYDRSTTRVCDRLIRIMPFDWWVWACRGELFILNPEGGIKCTGGSTPAIQVFANQFVEVCLNLNYDSLISGYMTLPCKIVPYEIESPVFTILSALNILVKRWITFDLTEGPTNRLSLRFTTIDDNDDDDDDDDDDNVGARRSRRTVESRELARRFVAAPATTTTTDFNGHSHSQLLDRVRSLAEKRRHALAAQDLTSDGGDAMTITEYQHTKEHDARSPMYVRSPVTREIRAER